jgi:hypothetical protein
LSKNAPEPGVPFVHVCGAEEAAVGDGVGEGVDDESPE